LSRTPLEGTRAYVFDAYGTLLDLASAVAAKRPLLGERADALSALWRQKQLEYTWLRSLMGRHADFEQVTCDSLDFALDSLGLASDPLRRELMQAYRRLTAYPEVPGVLERLGAAKIPRMILSNGSPGMLRDGVRAAGLEPLIDRILSVESVGIFKPHPDVYRLAVDTLGHPPDRIAFLSSNAWDVAGAATFGFRTVWINRANTPRERLPGTPVAEIPDLARLPALLGL
jgi:2-haloacid dehalogenase